MAHSNHPTVNTEHFRRNKTGVFFVICVLLFLGGLVMEYFQYKRNQDYILNDLQNRLLEHTFNVNLRLRTLKGYVMGLKTTAENNLFAIKNWKEESPLFPYVKEEGSDTFELDLKGLTAEQDMVGSFRGTGSLTALTPEVRDEINMALLLNTPFELAYQNNKGLLRVGYLSKNNFESIYPWTSTVQPKWHIETPPNQDNLWLLFHVYDGTMLVRNYSLVLWEGQELGIVFADLGEAELNRVMNRFGPFKGNLFLISQDLQILATRMMDSEPDDKGKLLRLNQVLPSETAAFIKENLKSDPGKFLAHGSYLICALDLFDAPWYMVYVSTPEILFAPAWEQMIEDIIYIGIALFLVLFLGYLYMRADFILPAQKLLEHIAREDKGLETSPHNLPARWKPWFDIVSRIFSEHRDLFNTLEKKVERRTKQLDQKNKALEKTLTDLKQAQDQIIVQEKLASLGSMAAGIAHEIKNPLHFILNFSDLSLEYVEELREKVSNENDLFSLIEQNITKVHDHAKRADSIVKSMLEHARGSTGEITTFPLREVLEEALDLAYVGYQGKEKNFYATIETHFGRKKIYLEGSKPDIFRVFLNIIHNACFALHEKQKKEGKDYKPTLEITTQDKGKFVEVLVKDNGIGMSKATVKKIFDPFFTTKAPGQGTGLGLSLSYDIITYQHRGKFIVESKEGEYTTFKVTLPKKMKRNDE